MFNEVRENVQDGARMAANMCKNSLKNVTSDNNKILHETLLDLFYSETALTFWISLVRTIVSYKH